MDVRAHVRLPPGDPPHPGIVLVDGSGPRTRHDLAPFEAPFAAAGLAVLAHDRPGCGDTGGDYLDQSLDDRIAESGAAVAALRAQPDVDADRVGLWGGSQGGWVVPGVAASVEVAFAVVCSAPSVTPFAQEAFSLEQRMRDDCAPGEEIAEAVAFFHHRAERLRRGDDPAEVAAEQDALAAGWLPYLTHDGRMDAAALSFLGRIGDHDPMPHLRRVACPVLAIWGERDPLVPVARSVAAYASALRGNPDVTLEVVPDADHGLRVPDAGAPDGRSRAPGMLDRMGRWAAARVG